VLPDLDSLLASFEPTLRRWQRLPPEAIWVGDMEQHGAAWNSELRKPIDFCKEQESDPFANCLLGPFEQSGMKSGPFCTCRQSVAFGDYRPVCAEVVCAE